MAAAVAAVTLTTGWLFWSVHGDEDGRLWRGERAWRKQLDVCGISLLWREVDRDRVEEKSRFARRRSDRACQRVNAGALDGREIGVAVLLARLQRDATCDSGDVIDLLLLLLLLVMESTFQIRLLLLLSPPGIALGEPDVKVLVGELALVDLVRLLEVTRDLQATRSRIDRIAHKAARALLEHVVLALLEDERVAVPLLLAP